MDAKARHALKSIDGRVSNQRFMYKKFRTISLRLGLDAHFFLAFPTEPQGKGECVSVDLTAGGEWNDVTCTSQCGGVVLCAAPVDYRWHHRSCGEGGTWRLLEAYDECLRYFHGIPDNSPKAAELLCSDFRAEVVRIDSAEKSDAINKLFPEEVQTAGLY